MNCGAGRRLLSGRGDTTRPMMEKVRAAAFDMLQAKCGSVARLPEGANWLDLFAGEASVLMDPSGTLYSPCCYGAPRPPIHHLLLRGLGFRVG